MIFINAKKLLSLCQIYLQQKLQKHQVRDETTDKIICYQQYLNEPTR